MMQIISTTHEKTPHVDWFRALVIGCGTLILCACKTVTPGTTAGTTNLPTTNLPESPPTLLSQEMPTTESIAPRAEPHRPRATISHQAPIATAAAATAAAATPQSAMPQSATPPLGTAPGKASAASNPALRGTPLHLSSQFQASNQAIALASGTLASGTNGTFPALPPEAWFPAPTIQPRVNGHHPGGGARTNGIGGGWKAPEINLPWHHDEFVCDGGDSYLPVTIADDWTVHGLDPEDSIAHYDTLNGETHVTASNKVCLYSPRFFAVRRVDGLLQKKQYDMPIAYDTTTRLSRQDDLNGPKAVNQPIPPNTYLGTKGSDTFQERTSGRTVDNTHVLATFRNEFEPYENFNIIVRGSHLNSEKTRLAAKMLAAATWGAADGLQLVIDGIVSDESKSATSAGQTFTYELPTGKSRMRIVKVASQENAQLGETVEFTFRFDNVGDQTIGNVTIIDNLTNRLEYVEGSAQCSLEADFLTVDADTGSLILRWEITAPMEVGDGGIIRFQCRVR